jgi:hypothetical protein
MTLWAIARTRRLEGFFDGVIFLFKNPSKNPSSRRVPIASTANRVISDDHKVYYVIQVCRRAGADFLSLFSKKSAVRWQAAKASDWECVRGLLVFFLNSKLRACASIAGTAKKDFYIGGLIG